MTQDDAIKMLGLLVRLFPSYHPTDDETRLWVGVFRAYSTEMCRAGIEGYKMETRFSKPNMGDLRAKLIEMTKAGARVNGAGCQVGDQTAAWKAEAEQHKVVLRRWLATKTDEDISGLAEDAARRCGPVLRSFLFDRSTRRPDVTKIRNDYFAAGMLHGAIG